MACRSYRTHYDGRLVSGECDCGWVSETLRSARDLHTTWFLHSGQANGPPLHRGIGEHPGGGPAD